MVSRLQAAYKREVASFVCCPITRQDAEAIPNELDATLLDTIKRITIKQNQTLVNQVGKPTQRPIGFGICFQTIH